jgi:hypothetical protein
MAAQTPPPVAMLTFAEYDRRKAFLHTVKRLQESEQAEILQCSAAA